MRLLVLGGTRFVGRTIVSAGTTAGWEVTVFNRGRSGSPPTGVAAVAGDRYRRDDVKRLAEHGPWDAIIDTSGYVPRNVLNVCSDLRSCSEQFMFMSTVSVYSGWPSKPLDESSPLLYCPPDADSDYGTDEEDGPTKYGYQKSGCEAAAVQVFGQDNVTIVRPGVVLGPREYVGRLPWWLNRIAAGGDVVAPGSPQQAIQPVDVRDLAVFALRTVENHVTGSFNIAGRGDETFEDLLSACIATTSSKATLVWVPNSILEACGVRQWSEMPLWRTTAGTWAVDSSHARQAGLVNRPIFETVKDTWSWLQSAPQTSANERSAEIGITREREKQVLRAAQGN